MDIDEETAEWPTRPWLLALVAAVGGVSFHFLTDVAWNEPLSLARQAGATFVAVATLAFVLIVEARRWTWSVAFALGWGAVLALVGWFTASYNVHSSIFEWPYLSGLFAVLLAAPLFQAARDKGAWRFPYARLHRHAWTDAVAGAAALAFTGIVFLLAWLIAMLFSLIDLDMVRKLLEKKWFSWTLWGFAFGGAIGLLKEKEKLLYTLQRLVRIVLAVLTPVLAVALIAFLLSLPFTGLKPLWDATESSTALLLVAAAGAVSLVNAVIGDGSNDRHANRIFFWAAMGLSACVLPLAMLAAVAMAQRIGQYGWTPERIWGVIAVAVAMVYGAAAWWALAVGRRDFDDRLRPLQIRIAQGLCVLALLLALPLIDFGAISAQSQLARLESGKVKPEAFDWRAMAFDFGPAGRSSLARIASSGAPDQRRFAATALAAKTTDLLTAETVNAGPVPKELTVVPGSTPVPPELRALLLGGPGIKEPFCSEGGACRVFPQLGGTTFVAFLDGCANMSLAARNDPDIDCTRSPGVFEQREGKWTNVYDGGDRLFAQISPPKKGTAEEVASLANENRAMESGDVRIVTVTRRQLAVGGKRSGNIFN